MEEFQHEQPTAKKSLDNTTVEWEPDLDVTLPINGSDIPGFKAWVNFNDFHFDPENPTKGHDGYDFASYVTNDGRVVLGLPAETKIRAVADGLVAGIGYPDSYAGTIRLEHGSPDGGMVSDYVHAKSELEPGSQVKKGDVIGTLYQDPEGDIGRLVHLHLTLVNGWSTGGNLNERKVDPSFIDSRLKLHPALPKGSPNFTVANLPGANLIVANFRTILVNGEMSS